MITLKELAEECNVSIATVSNILNGKSNVSEETKARVLKVVKKHGYKPNLMARSLRVTKTKTIGILVDDLGAFGTPEIIEGITSFLEKNSYKVVIQTLRIFTSIGGQSALGSEAFLQKLEASFQEMLAIRVEAVIYIAAYSRQIDYLPENFSLPIVLAYATTDNKLIPCVIPDDLTAAEEATEYLIKHGGKKIALIKGIEQNIHSQLREEGFRSVMKKQGLTIVEELIENAEWNAESAYAACQKIFEKGRPDSIFCFNDYMAAGAYQFLLEHDIKPGKDINIIGFDNNRIAKGLPPPLTTMGIGVYGIGNTAARLTVDLLDNKTTSERIFKIPCRIIERDSVKEMGISKNCNF